MKDIFEEMKMISAENYNAFFKVKDDFNPLSAIGPLLGHTYNYVECHGATFGPLVCGLILKLLHNNLSQYGRLYEKIIFQHDAAFYLAFLQSVCVQYVKI